MKRQKIKQFFQRKEIIFRPVNAIGSLRSDDDDEGDGNGNEKGKKARSLGPVYTYPGIFENVTSP